LYRFVFSGILAAALAAHAAPAETGQLDGSPSLFTVMAAINAAGYDADLGSPNNHPLRMAVRQELAKRNIPSLAAIREFVAKHKLGNETAEIGQYISFALSSSGPPNFAFKQRDVDIPPDASALSDLGPLLAKFYNEAGIAELWKRAQPGYDQVIERYHQPISDAILQVNLYLRQPTSGFPGRHFQIFVEPQGAPNQIQSRSYGNEYTVVVTPSAELRTFDIRHGYLHYLLDPMATREQEVLKRKKPIADHALRAMALEDSYKEDFLLLTTESLIKAVEARMDKNPQAATAAFKQGFILTPYFTEQLAAFEKQEASMMVYYKDMVAGIDLLKEDARLREVEFDRRAPIRTVKTAPVPEATAPVLTGPAKALDDAEKLFEGKQFDAAKKRFLSVLEQTDQRPAHAAAYYGLARVAATAKQPEDAERLFKKALELDPDPRVKAWSLVYLGRLELATEQPDVKQAGEYFQQALQVEGAPEQARKLAQQGLQQSSKK
jgi:tetratricopeptide (TPR) repeat protein